MSSASKRPRSSNARGIALGRAHFANAIGSSGRPGRERSTVYRLDVYSLRLDSGEVRVGKDGRAGAGRSTFRHRSLARSRARRRLVEGDRRTGGRALADRRGLGRRRRHRRSDRLIVELVDVARARRDSVDAREDGAGPSSGADRAGVGVLRADVATTGKFAEVGGQQYGAIDGDGQAALEGQHRRRRLDAHDGRAA